MAHSSNHRSHHHIESLLSLLFAPRILHLVTYRLSAFRVEVDASDDRRTVGPKLTAVRPKEDWLTGLEHNTRTTQDSPTLLLFYYGFT